MPLKVSEMKKLLDLGNKYKVQSIKVGEFEVHFQGQRLEARHPVKPVTVSSGPQIPTTQPIGLEHGMPTDDEMMFWSTDTMPEIKSEPPKES